MKKLLALALALAAGNAFAAIGSTTFQVQATVAATCDIVVTPLNFGTYDVVAAGNGDQQATITLHCTKGATPKVALSGTSPRQMTGGASGDKLTYELYSDSGRTTAWYSAVTASASTSKNTAIPMTIYGRIPSTATNDVSADTYTDTVTATVSF